MAGRALVLDANILIRALLGKRVRHILETYVDSVLFFVPETAYSEAERHLSALVVKRGGDPAKALALLRALVELTELVSEDIYGNFEAEARRRSIHVTPDDWPILASALSLGCPIRTEDTDFFGCGVPTWTSDRVEIFLDD